MTHPGTRNRHRGRLIELFGPPGAGKTTLVKSVAEQSDIVTRHQLSARWSSRSLAFRARQVAMAYLSVQQIAGAAQAMIRLRLFRREGLFRLAKLIAKQRWLRSQDATVLLDQGMLQELYSALFASGRKDVDAASLAPLIKLLYRGLDVQILVIEVAPSVASARIGKRTYGRSKLDRLRDDRLDAELQRTLRLQGRIIEAARLADLPIEVLDGHAPVVELSDHIARTFSLPKRLSAHS